MILRAKKRLRENMKRKKRHVMLMFVSMNTVNTSNVQHMNTRAQQQIYPQVRWKRLWKSKNITTKTLTIVL